EISPNQDVVAIDCCLTYKISNCEVRSEFHHGKNTAITRWPDGPPFRSAPGEYHAGTRIDQLLNHQRPISKSKPCQNARNRKPNPKSCRINQCDGVKAHLPGKQRLMLNL